VRQIALNTVSSLLARASNEKQTLQSVRRTARVPSILLTALHFKKPNHYTASSAEENKK
jgi:hypothetical protein